MAVESGSDSRPRSSSGATDGRGRTSGWVRAGKVAAGTFLSALLVGASGATVELLNGGDPWGVVPLALLMMWGTTLAAAATLVVPTWAGWRWPRRVLGAAGVGTGGYAAYWLSYEQVEAAGLLVALSVVALSAVAVTAAAAAESTEHGSN